MTYIDSKGQRFALSHRLSNVYFLVYGLTNSHTTLSYHDFLAQGSHKQLFGVIAVLSGTLRNILCLYNFGCYPLFQRWKKRVVLTNAAKLHVICFPNCVVR